MKAMDSNLVMTIPCGCLLSHSLLNTFDERPLELAASHIILPSGASGPVLPRCELSSPVATTRAEAPHRLVSPRLESVRETCVSQTSIIEQRRHGTQRCHIVPKKGPCSVRVGEAW